MEMYSDFIIVFIMLVGLAIIVVGLGKKKISDLNLIMLREASNFIDDYMANGGMAEANAIVNHLNIFLFSKLGTFNPFLRILIRTIFSSKLFRETPEMIIEQLNHIIKMKLEIVEGKPETLIKKVAAKTIDDFSSKVLDLSYAGDNDLSHNADVWNLKEEYLKDIDKGGYAEVFAQSNLKETQVGVKAGIKF